MKLVAANVREFYLNSGKSQSGLTSAATRFVVGRGTKFGEN